MRYFTDHSTQPCLLGVNIFSKLDFFNVDLATHRLAIYCFWFQRLMLPITSRQLLSTFSIRLMLKKLDIERREGFKPVDDQANSPSAAAETERRRFALADEIQQLIADATDRETARYSE
jgi:hypothetical protein